MGLSVKTLTAHGSLLTANLTSSRITRICADEFFFFLIRLIRRNLC